MNQSAPRSLLVARFFRHFLAAYVLYHAASMLVGSIPAPLEALDRTAWKEPTVQEEFAGWADGLQRLGWEVQPAELEEHAWRLTRRWTQAVQEAMTPFRTYQRYTGTVQAWSMFVAAHHYPSRLHVDVLEPGGQWRPVYVARSPEAAWRGGQLDHFRFRSAIFRYSWPQYERPLHEFVNWLAAEAGRDFPNATHLRARFFTARTGSPAEVRAGGELAGAFSSEIVVPLDAQR